MTVNEQLWWFVARATGLTAWGLATLSVLGGLALAARAVRGRPTAVWQTDLHRFAGATTVVLTLAHMAALVADSYVRFDVVDLLVPFASSWKRVPVALGVVALWALLAVEVTSLAKARMSRAAWRRVHYASYVVWVAATAHLFTAGTDAGRVAVASTAVSLTGVVFLVSYRLLTRRSPRTSALPATPGSVAAHARREAARLRPTG